MNITNKILKISKGCRLSENEIISHVKNSCDNEAEWLGKETYILYYAIGRVFKPKSMIEIGTRFGYSMAAIYKGSQKLKHIFSYDNEQDFSGSQDYVYKKFKERKLKTLNFNIINTKDIIDLSLPFAVDLAHIDAEHTFNGAYRDLSLIFKYIKNGGIILVDDIENQEVKKAADKFCLDFNQTQEYLPCYRGMYVIRVNLHACK